MNAAVISLVATMESVGANKRPIVLALVVLVLLCVAIWLTLDIRRFKRDWPTPHKDPEKRAVCAECEFVCAPTRGESLRATAICGHPTRNFPERHPITGVYKMTRPDAYEFNSRGQCRLFKRGGWVDLTPRPIEHIDAPG